MPTGIGYTIQVPIRSLDAEDVKNAFALYYNYQEKVDLGLGVLENNPVSKEEFVTSCCTQFMLNIYKNYMIEKAEIEAKNLAIQESDTRAQDVTVWFDTLRTESYIVNPYTNFPTATSGLAFTTNMLTPVEIILEGSDPENLPLTFEISESPYYNTNTSSNIVTLTPNQDFYGNTVMEFRAYNGTKYSPVYYHEIHVTDTRPVSSHINLVFDMGEVTQGFISASDPRSMPLTYEIVDHPTKGSVSLTDNDFEYTPHAGEFGDDSFTFKVSNSEVSSPLYLVSIFMNDLRPYSDHYAASTVINTPVDVTVSSTDPRSLPVSYTVVTNPSNGSVQVSGDTFTYTPSNNFEGVDVVTFKATNGTFSSENYNIEFTVTGV